MNVSWFDGSSMYQIFPLGLCGSPHENSWDWSNTWNAASRPVRRVDRILNWVEHLKKLGIKSIFFNLALQSDTHGYNTRDFYTLDSRLGSNEDFAEVCKVLHDNGFRIVFDALFTNVGRGFWAFRDVRANLENSKYIDWFKDIDFKSNTPCNDGFYYKAWKNNWDFPELNLDNEDVVQHIFGAVRKSEDLYRFDGKNEEKTEGFDSGFQAIYFDGECFIANDMRENKYFLTDGKGAVIKELASDPASVSLYMYSTVAFTDDTGYVSYYDSGSKELVRTDSKETPQYIFAGKAVFDAYGFISADRWKSGEYGKAEAPVPERLDDEYFAAHYPNKTVLHIYSDMTVCVKDNIAFNNRLMLLGKDYVMPLPIFL